MLDIVTYEKNDNKPYFNWYAVNLQTKVKRGKVLEAVCEDSGDLNIIRKILMYQEFLTT